MGSNFLGQSISFFLVVVAASFFPERFFEKPEIHGSRHRVVFALKVYIYSIALLSHNTLKWSAILQGADRPGNPCYGVQAYLVNFTLHFQSNATLDLLLNP